MSSEKHQKVQPCHLQRDAYLYLRQSTLRQVVENTESTQHQYALRQHAVALGWPLEHFHLLCSVSGAKKEASAVCEGNGLEGLFRCTQQLFVGPGSVAAEDLFDLAPHRLDGIEIRRIGRQIQQPDAGGFEGFPDSPDFVCGQIVQNHHLARAPSGREPLRPPSQKHFAVHGAFKKPRSAGTLQPNAGDQRAGLIVSVGDVRQQSLPTQRTAPQARHLGVGSAFVHKHQRGRGLGSQPLMPVRPFFSDVGAFLFGGGQSFF